jgi:hypothetical protein
MTFEEKYEIQRKIAALPVGEQVEFIEAIARNLRKEQFTDHEKMRREIEEMVNDPEFMKIMNNEDLPYPGAPEKKARNAAG